jgi:hypothetical protein
MLAAGGPAMRNAALQALDATDPAALGSFVESGWERPWQTDQRVRISRCERWALFLADERAWRSARAADPNATSAGHPSAHADAATIDRVRSGLVG